MKTYRLKKDLPTLKAGMLFTMDEDSYGAMFDHHGVFMFNKKDIDNFDEWFEDLGNRKWTQNQIKQIEFGEYKSVYVVVRFIKRQHYIYDDKEFGSCVFYNEVGEVKKIRFDANESKFWQQKDYDILNQMVRDGYIEIEDNPNIVWKDEK